MAAANSIFKLKVETSEYDQKLANAAKGIRHLADVAHQSGGELTGLEKAELDYIKALGEMETKSRTASGQVRELSSTYKELKVVYDQLNEVEKSDEGGKALAASLETLKQRAQEAKSQLDTATQSLQSNGEAGKGTSGIMEVLKDKFTVNIDALKLFNAGLTASKAALDVAKDAFFASESTVDEWGRILDSSKSLYEGFLTALNTGDISGYLGRIDEIVQAARTAYNELDRLGTMKTIQAPKMSAQQTENERMRMMIQTGRYIAPVDGRKASMKDGQLLTPEQIHRLETQLQNGMKTVVSLVGNEVKQTGKAIDAVYNRQAKELGMSLSEFRKGTSSMAEFDKRMAGYEKYQKWRSENYYTDNWGNTRVKEGNPFEEYKKWGTFRVDGERYNDLVRLIQQRDQQAGQAYSTQSQAYRTMNRAEGITVSKLMKGETAGGTTTLKTTARTSSPQQRAEEQIKDALSKYNDAIGLATKQMEAGNITEAEFKNKLLSQQQRLYDAYGQAYNTYADPKYKDAQQKAADEIVRLGGEVKAATGAQKKTQEAARQLEQAQKELAKYEAEAAAALKRNDLTSYYAATSKVEASKAKIAQMTTPVTSTQEDGLARARKAQSIKLAPKEFTISANDEDALAKVRKIQGVKLSPKEFTITATDEDALAKVRKIQGVKLSPKEFTITATDDDALAKVRKMEGVKLTPKTFVVTAETADAMTQLRDVMGEQVPDKAFTISATDEALPLLQAIEGVSIEPKTFVVTAETDDALSQLREVVGEQVPDKAFTISATDEALPLLQAIEGISIQPKEFTITATDEEALAKVRKIQGVNISPKDFTISTDNEEALAKVQKIQGIKLTPKEFTITATDEEALAKVRKILGVKLAPKEFTISADDEDALAKVRKIQGVAINPKEFSVTADTDDAMTKLRDVIGEQVPDKAFTISATDEALPLLKSIEGVSIEPKTFVVTAETADAMMQLREVIGEQVPDKAFTISATDESLPLLKSIEGISIQPKEFTITASDEEALAKVRKIQGVNISPKDFTITTDNEEALAKVRKIQGVKLSPKEFTITASDEEALAKVRKMEGVKLTPKTFVVTAETADAMTQLREVIGEQVPDKAFTISATDEALPLLKSIEGVSIEPKTFVVTAETADALSQLREVLGEQVPDKAFNITATDEALPMLQAIEGVSITPKTFSVTAETADALSQLREVIGEQIPDKAFTISATDEALPLLQAIEGVSITPKEFSVTATTDDAMTKIREVVGAEISDKGFTISATDEALPLLQAIEGVSITPKEFVVTANTEQAQESIKKLDALSEQTEESLAKTRKPQGQQNVTTPNFTLTQKNLSGFIGVLQKKFEEEDITIDLFGDLTSQLNDAKMLSSAIQTALKNGLNPAALGLDNIWKQVFNINPGDYIDDSQWEELRKKMEAIIGKPIEINFQTGEMKTLNNDAKTTEKSFREAASAVSSVSSALQQLEDPSAKIAGIIGQAIANIALGFAQATASDSKLGVFGWIAAITGGLATMVSTISAIHNATGYAQGGIVKGSTYSGDRVQGLVDGVTPVGLNAGEVVLNHSQQATLAAELTNRDNSGATSSRPYVDAETIYLGVNNYLKRSGRGEIVTTKNK